MPSTYFTRIPDRPIALSFLMSGATAWLWAVVLMGRALPWQVSRWWIVAFGLVFLVSLVWWLYFFRRATALAGDAKGWNQGALFGATPQLVLSGIVLGLAYASDQVNALLARANWHLQVIVGLAILTVIAALIQSAAVLWLSNRDLGITGSLRITLLKHAESVVMGCLVVIGILQSSASVAPIGDDVRHYSEVADALLEGRVWGLGSGYVGSLGNMGVTYSALPVFPVLLALSFILVGRTVLAVALPTVIATALFPLAAYAAVRAIVGSRPVAFTAAVLLSLFPIYQIHILGGPSPDTLFIVLLLFAAALAGKANSSGRRRHWIGLGLVLGLATLTRHEGIAYSLVFLLTFLAVHAKRSVYWLFVMSFLATLAPFAALHYLWRGSLWPAALGGKPFVWDNVDTNLNNLWWASFPWYSQAIGVDRGTLIGLVIAAMIGVGLGAAILARRRPALLAIPLAGAGNIIMVLFMHPSLVYSIFPPDFLRHISYGIAYGAVALAVAGHSLTRVVLRFAGGLRLALLCGALLLAAAGLFYETERLARPDWAFEGKWSLLWTGEYYLLVDVVERHPVALWTVDDARSWEQMRSDLQSPFQEVSLQKINRSESYHWATLMVGFLGLVSSLVPPSRMCWEKPSSAGGFHSKR